MLAMTAVNMLFATAFVFFVTITCAELAGSPGPTALAAVQERSEAATSRL